MMNFAFERISRTSPPMISADFEFQNVAGQIRPRFGDPLPDCESAAIGRVRR
jgi:hypothetical protein